MIRPIVIAGGGLAGAAAACLVARGGGGVTLFERTTEPTDKICGEFISAEAAAAYLAHAGVDPHALGAHPIREVRLILGSRMVRAALPFTGLGLSRAVLDEALLREAAHRGASIRRGVTVKWAGSGGGLAVEADGARVPADALFLATGKHDLRGLRRGGPPSDRVGFKLHLRLKPEQHAALTGAVELVMLRDGYAGLQRIENGRANLCLLVSRSRTRRLGDWAALFEDLLRTEPHLRTRLADAIPLSDPSTIAGVPFGFLHAPAADDPPGLFRLGDQMAVIPSFTGDGMAIALHSAVLAASVHLAGGPAADYHRRMRADIGRQIRRAMLLDRTGSGGFGQRAIMALATLWPAGPGLAARLTRLPARGVARALALHEPARHAVPSAA